MVPWRRLPRTAVTVLPLLDVLGVPRAMLPEVRDSAADFGMTRADLFGREIPILGIAGDQQAALFGQPTEKDMKLLSQRLGLGWRVDVVPESGL